MNKQTSGGNSQRNAFFILGIIVILTMMLVWIMIPPRPNRKVLMEDSAIFMETSFGDSATAKTLRWLSDNKDISDSAAYDSAYKIGKQFHVSGQDLASLEYSRHMIEKIKSLKNHTSLDTELEGRSMMLVGVAAERLGLPMIGLDYSTRGLKIAAEIDDQILRANLYNNIGVLLSNNGDYNAATSYYRKALAINKQLGNTANIYLIHNNLAETALENNDYNQALDDLLSAIQFINKDNDTVTYYYLQSCLGLVYAKRNELTLAESYLNNAICHLSKTNRNDYKMAAFLSNAELHFQKGNRDSVDTFLQLAYECVLDSKDTQLMLDYLREKKHMMSEYGDWESAYKAQSEIDNIRDSLYAEENKDRFHEISRLHDIGFETTKGKSWLSNIDQTKLSWALGAGSGLLIIGIVILFIQKRRKHNLIMELSATNESLQANMNESIAKERKEKLEITEQLDTNNRRLSTLTLDKIRNANIIESLDKTLRLLHTSISVKDKEIRKLANDAVSMLEQLQSDSNRWEEFELYFEKVHPKFYRNLSARHPDLTVKERHLCALLALDLSTKDIASITFREIRSVESSRLRLRKKLALDSDSNLTDYINSLLFLINE